MAFIPNTKMNLNLIFKTFKGVCWINTKHFFVNRPIDTNRKKLDLTIQRQKQKQKDWRVCPDSFLQKLEIRGYALNTAKTYISCFEKFINHYSHLKLIEIDENDIRNYLQYLVHHDKSDSEINQAINSIKFYYEVVLEMPNRFYSIDRPKSSRKLPKVLAMQDIRDMIHLTKNIKHKCILGILYSGGLRISELQNLELEDIDSKRMLIHIRDAKGKKDRYVQLSKSILPELRQYYIAYKPIKYLFEGKVGGCYSTSSISKVVKKAAKIAGVQTNVHAHMIRHSYATHLLENGTSLRHIQQLLGHSSSKTTEIYTHVATSAFKDIKNPLDYLS